MTSLFASVALIALFPPAGATGESVPETLAARIPGVEAEHVQPTPVPGLWEVTVGTQVVYISEDGRYMVRGELIDLKSGESLTENRSAQLRVAEVRNLDEARMVIFSPDEPKHTVTVFTDIDCGYCRRLHREIQAYNRLGIRVRYLFYPLAGPGSKSWAKAEAVWCSTDRHAALTRAKAGEDVTANQPCEDTPVAEHYRIGEEFGVRGTPAMLTEDGVLLPGYLPPDQLAAWLADR
jgi:thiol:disulfide interchange protein DsbC